jgi:hypothetical protein
VRSRGGIPTPAGLRVESGETHRSAALVGWPSYPRPHGSALEERAKVAREGSLGYCFARGVVGERDAARERLDQKSVLRRAGSILNDYVKQDGFAGRCAMPNSRDLMKRARMFEERAEQAPDLISRQHYREMAAHYRSLAVEHQETRATLERELEHGNSD